MTFAYIRFLNEPLKKNIFEKLMPKKYYKKRLERKNPVKLNELSVFGQKGFEAYLPVTYNEMEEDFDFAKSLYRNLLYMLMDKGVSAVLAETELFDEGDVFFAKGSLAMSLMIFETVKKLARFKETELKDLKVLIVDGSNPETDIVLNILGRSLNFITVVTENPKNFNDLYDEIYYDSGLSVDFISSFKQEQAKDADIIINLSREISDGGYYYKEGCVYLDLVKNAATKRRIIKVRPDITYIDGMFVKDENCEANELMFELMLYVSNKSFKKIADGKEIFNAENKIIEDISLSSLSRFGKKIIY